ncbi:SseB family protein [Thermomonospora umbrina]|uniref:Type III secretion system (T3SS) SseB-like protein n=1 Tax=Thermomonospora umbrina TaxID=111806 RepID=A0A3D9SNF3_9ACTN|nr:SseB family protein [Thermomonospora umbrina]REE95493.1 type III secretion system (T3SS) SseB-like protein [Thermomonospora umbrina]
MEWSEFARRLGRELAGLDHGVILIVRERVEDRHYVQAIREPDRLYAEAVSNHFLDGPLLLTAADEEVMVEAGWNPPGPRRAPGETAVPTGDPAPHNWWTELSYFATAADHARLADMMVHALRDVQGVRRPADLEYESFRRLGNGRIELADFGIAPADPSRLTERRSSADAVAAAPPVVDPVMSAPVNDSGPEARPRAANGVSRERAVAQARPVPMPAPPAVLAPADGEGEPERRLTAAKQEGDHVTYFDVLLRSELILPVADDPTAGDLVTITIADSVYVMVFSSPRALAQSLRPGEPVPPPHRRMTFGALAASWPDPSWSLAVNPGLPSEIHLDAAAVARIDGTRRGAAEPPAPATGPLPVQGPSAPVAAPVPVPAPLPTPLPAPVPQPTPEPEPVRAAGKPLPLPLPHGVQLWGDDGEGESARPLAVYDAISGGWTRVPSVSEESGHLGR